MRFMALLRFLCIVPLAHANDKWMYSEVSDAHSVAQKFGNDLWRMAESVTNKKKYEEAYAGSDIVTIDGSKMIRHMSAQLSRMIRSKISALEMIVDHAEQFSLKPMKEMEAAIKQVGSLAFSNAKNLTAGRKKELSENSNFFGIPVSTNFSTVHVPTNVYEGGNETAKVISWSEKLDKVFYHNYVNDPTLSWQYFGSVTGITRIYPGVEWLNDKTPTDMYDCRVRPWYIGAATSPKDMVILVDNSGSMMGQKQEIARNIINTILETLGPNDFVNVFYFNDTVNEVVPCFQKKLIQANLENIRELKIGVKNMESASSTAEFCKALKTAFQILEEHRHRGKAAMCNQGIMLVSDGVSDNCKEVFETYNWRNSTKPPFPVRVFTYHIGRDGADSRSIKWMACANQGYYVRLNTMAEVREEVLKYVNVMARPLVLNNTRITSWTSVYADVTDPKLSDWLWEMEQNEEQKNNTIDFRKNKKRFLSAEGIRKRYDRYCKRILDQTASYQDQPYSLMTTVSLPAFDQRNNSTGMANLLGVAATDIPILDFKRILSPFKLGVNNYGFIVDNNGYIILHPDLRPTFRGILKPGYSSVDVTEVETVDDDYNLRNFSKYIADLRDKIINQSYDSHTMIVKYHYDNIRRVAVSSKRYFMQGVEPSPFTAVIVISSNAEHKVAPPTDVHVGINGYTASTIIRINTNLRARRKNSYIFWNLLHTHIGNGQKIR